MSLFGKLFGSEKDRSARTGERGGASTCVGCGTTVVPQQGVMPERNNGLVCPACGGVSCMVCLAQKAQSEGVSSLACAECGNAPLSPTHNAYRG